MPESWSRLEVEASVSAYFVMLDLELRGLPFNKSESRRWLRNQLENRSEAAIERKHQNISAVLIDLGFPYIAGYKPLSNYQQLLFDVVDERLGRATELKVAATRSALEPASVGDAADILSRLTEVPKTEPRLPQLQIRDRARASRETDFLELEARNHSLGTAGEEFALRFEFARLVAEGCDDLAHRMEHVAVTRGAGEGYDVLSFETSGRERLIEVKTTSYGDHTPFFVTPHELALSCDRADQYFLYRIFEFRRDPRLYVVGGDISRSFSLTASQFVARLSSG